MVSIGAISFAFVSRAAEPPGEQVEDVTRPHVDGTALQKMGTRGDTYRIVGVLGADSAAAAKAAVNTIKGLAGTIVDVIDDHAITWEDVAILRVRIRSMKGVAKVAGLMAGATKIITVDFDCRDTRTEP